VYGLAVVDDRGRIADRPVVRALGWTDATRLDLRAGAGRILVRAAIDGRHSLAARDRLPLPAYLRRSSGIEPGDSVLLAAEPADGVLAIHPLASLDALLNTMSAPTVWRPAA
jgi:hypothetical protein